MRPGRLRAPDSMEKSATRRKEEIGKHRVSGGWNESVEASLPREDGNQTRR